MKIKRLLSLALAALFLLAVQSPVLAQNAAEDPERALLADFPPLSIDSVERAEDAIKRLPSVREALSRRYMREKAECLERFFVASCLSDLRSRERKATKAVNRIDVEAKAFLRRERAAERDRIVAERERRAAEEGGKSIPYSGAARNSGRNGQGTSEGRDASRRIHIEQVPAPETDTNPEVPASPPADSDEVSTPNVAEPLPEPPVSPGAGSASEQVPAMPDAGQLPTAPETPPSPEAPAPEAPSSAPTVDNPSPAGEPAREPEAKGEVGTDTQAPSAVPTEASPTEASPAQATPTEATPTEASSTEASPTEATPAEATPAEANPVESNPAEATPSEAIPVEATPSETSPVEANLTETTPNAASTTDAAPAPAPAPAAESDGQKPSGDEPAGATAMPANQ